MGKWISFGERSVAAALAPGSGKCWVTRPGAVDRQQHAVAPVATSGIGQLQQVAAGGARAVAQPLRLLLIGDRALPVHPESRRQPGRRP